MSDGGADAATAHGAAGTPAPETPEEPVVEAVGLHRSFADVEGEGAGPEIHVLRGVDLSVHGGDTVSIVGPSGSGKSTLLHLLGGLDRPSAGSVRLGGRVLGDLSDPDIADLRNRHVGFVFQFHHLLRDFSALENVMVPQIVGGASRGEARQRASTLLDQVGLSQRRGHRPSELSGGEQQRVAVARALANEPPLLLADEPSGNLDVDTSERLHDLLFRMVEEHGSALVVVTHNRTLAGRARRRLRLAGGSLEPAAERGAAGA